MTDPGWRMTVDTPEDDWKVFQKKARPLGMKVAPGPLDGFRKNESLCLVLRRANMKVGITGRSYSKGLEV